MKVMLTYIMKVLMHKKNNKLSNKERTSEFCFLMSGCCVDRGVLRSGLI